MALALRVGMMIRQLLIPVVFAAACPAHTVCIDTGTVGITIPHIMGRIVDLLLYWSGFVSITLFIVGGLLMIGSGGSDTFLSTGKKIMKGSLIGLAIVLGSWMILSTVLYFITF